MAAGSSLAVGQRLRLMPYLMRTVVRDLGGRLGRALGLLKARAVELPAPPDSKLAREAEGEAQARLSLVVLNHSHRAYAFGAALAAIEGVAFDRELLYVAALLHDTGLPTPVPGVDFTVASAEVAKKLMSGERLETVQRAITRHHSPAVTLAEGPEAWLLSAGAGLDVMGINAWRLKKSTRDEVVARWPRASFKRDFTKLWLTECERVPGGPADFLRVYGMASLAIRLAPFDE